MAPRGFAAETKAAYPLESMELRGTKRLSPTQLQKNLNIRPNDLMTDEYVSELRAQILGLGLFKDALFSLQRGHQPNTAKLIISVVDDDSVVGYEALGGEFALLVAEPERTAMGEDTPFRSYHFGLVARNLFGNMHRGVLFADLDPKGTVISSKAAYGMPRFAAEGVQLDAALSVTDPMQRYLDTQAFGMKIQSLWSHSLSFGEVQYGAGWYANTHRRYRLAGWPSVAAGPKFGLMRESRFMGFVPGDGWRSGVHVMPSLVKREQAITEWQLAGTWSIKNYVALTGDLQATTVGRTGITTREEIRLDIPLTNDGSEGTKALLFAKVRQGQDHYQDFAFKGSDAAIGVRYHSSGFIGELSFQIVEKKPFHQADAAFANNAEVALP